MCSILLFCKVFISCSVMVSEFVLMVCCVSSVVECGLLLEVLFV